MFQLLLLSSSRYSLLTLGSLLTRLRWAFSGAGIGGVHSTRGRRDRSLKRSTRTYTLVPSLFCSLGSHSLTAWSLLPWLTQVDFQSFIWLPSSVFSSLTGLTSSWCLDISELQTSSLKLIAEQLWTFSLGQLFSILFSDTCFTHIPISWDQSREMRSKSRAQVAISVEQDLVKHTLWSFCLHLLW